MSAPHGPQGPNRGGGRGKLRGGLHSRGGATTPRAGSQARKSKPVTQENGFRNNTRRNDPKSAIAKHLNGIKTPSPLSRVTTNSPEKQSWRDPTTDENGEYKERMHELWTTLKKNREKERKDAIRKGFLADPDKPTLLANAITPVGTCQDMCPEFERVERIVQQMVDGCEKTSAQFSDTKVPCEEYMVKRFRRSAAGYDEQLPSDIRPPLVLQRCLNYLFNEVVGGSQPLATVHKFVWDRTRGIRNDFSIQQVTKTDDLRIAIDCFERIARFHILCLHQLSHPNRDNGEFDHHQEREQLNNTLLSLMYYYDDSRHKLNSPNEAEFRAYCIIFEIQDQRPDLEDRAQNWPRSLLKDQRIQTALQLYAAAGNTSDDQGPLRPRTHFSIAQGNYGRFWSIIASNRVSYLMACTAEIYFNFVRSMALDSIWKAYKRGGSIKLEDWVLGDLMNALGFDTEDQVASFCEDHGFTIGEREDGNSFLDISSVSGRSLTDSNPRRKQVFSKTLVEQKRLGRTLPAVINGFSVSLARANGLIEDSSDSSANSPPTTTNDESLFLSDGSSEDESKRESKSKEPQPVTSAATTAPVINPFAKPFNPVPASNPFRTAGASTASTPLTSVFAVPSGTLNTPSVFGQPSAPTVSASTVPTSVFAVSSGTLNTPSVFGQPSAPKVLSNHSPTPSVAQPASVFPFGPPSFTGNVILKATLSPSTSSSDSVTLATSSGSLPGATSIFSTSSPKTTPNFTSFYENFLSTNQPANATDQNQSLMSQGDLARTTSNPFKAPPSSFQISTPLAKSEAPAAFPPAQTLTPTQPSQAPFSFIPQQTNPTVSATKPTDTLSSQSSTLFAGTPSFADNTFTPPSFFNHPQPSLTSKPVIDKLLFLSNPSQNPQLGEVQDPFKLSTTSSTFLSKCSDTPSTPSTSYSRISETTIGPPKPDPRPQLLDQLAEEIICENNGLLQQFLDYTIRPMIVEAITQVRKEQIQAKIDTARRFLLGKKYLRRWKENAWKRGLLRKGRERRKNFAQSMRELSMSQRGSPSSSRRASEISELGSSLIERFTMPPPTIPPPLQSSNSSHKRNSLPSGSQARKSAEESDCSSIHCNRPPPAPAVSVAGKGPMQPHHRRSRTLGVSTLFSTSNRITKTNSQSIINPKHSFNGSASLLSHSVLTKARRLVPPGPTDTTRTDYFRLKSLGLDPDTPVVPTTRKRRISDHTDVEARKRLSPPKEASSVSQPMRSIGSMSSADSRTEITGDDEDEELFAQMRQVRNAMAESITFFREEREKSELSRSNSSSRDNSTIKETDKERRLREFQNTPSRTEVRLTTTGSHGLFPKTWGQDKGKGKAMDEQSRNVERMNAPASRPMGFSAIGRGSEFGVSRDSNGGGGMGTGASADDAIEL